MSDNDRVRVDIDSKEVDHSILLLNVATGLAWGSIIPFILGGIFSKKVEDPLGILLIMFFMLLVAGILVAVALKPFRRVDTKKVSMNLHELYDVSIGLAIACSPALITAPMSLATVKEFKDAYDL